MVEGCTLQESFAIQWRVTKALVMREILDRYGRHNIGFMWMFFEPMLFTLAVTALWTVAGMGHGSDFPIVAFAITGYSPVLLWRNMPSRCEKAVQANHTLMHHRNVKLMDIYASRLLLEGGGATISFFLLTIFFGSLGWVSMPYNLLEVAFGWIMMAWFGCSLAILVGASAERLEFIGILWHPTSYILFPLSGAAFSVDTLPPAFQTAVLYVPMVHAVECIREGFLGPLYTAHYDLSYLACWNLALSILGCAQMRYVSRKIIA